MFLFPAFCHWAFALAGVSSASDAIIRAVCLEQAGQVCEKFLPRDQLIVSTEGQGADAAHGYRANGHGKRIDMPMVVLVNGEQRQRFGDRGWLPPGFATHHPCDRGG